MGTTDHPGQQPSASLAYYLNFSARPEMFQPGGPLHDTGQADTLALGPLTGYVEITQEALNCGPDEIATRQNGYWRINAHVALRTSVCSELAGLFDGLLFSDVDITARKHTPAPERTVTHVVDLPESWASDVRDALMTSPRAGSPEMLLLLSTAYDAIQHGSSIGAINSNKRLLLDLSTEHITPATNKTLTALLADTAATGQHPDAWPTVLHAGWGYLIRVPGDLGDHLLKLPADIARVIAYAADQDADWVLLDADAPRCPDLPTYPWE